MSGILFDLGKRGMRTRESIYVPLGYSVEYVRPQKYKGTSEKKEMCRASKDGQNFYVFHDPGWYTKIMEIQDSIPHMAKFSMPAQGHILLSAAPGVLMSDLDEIQGIDGIERQLLEFADAGQKHRLVHGDIRQWNVLLDSSTGGITVIDWNLSRFGESKVDFEDIAKLVKLLKGEIGFHEAWNWKAHDLPKWCKP